MPVQDHFGSDSHAEAFAKLDPKLDSEPTATYRKLRDMWLKASFDRKQSEALPSPWREYCLSSLEWSANRNLESLALLDRGSRFSPRFYWLRYYVAEILVRRLDLYDMARAEIQAVAAKCPWLWEARCLWTEILMAVGHADPLKAVRDVRVPEGSRASFLAWRGALELWWGEYALAVKDLDEAAAMDNPDALCWRGGALCKLGRLEESQRDLDRLLTLDPKDPEGLVWRGELRRLRGDKEGALRDLADVIAISGNKPWARVNRALIRLEEKDVLGAWRDFACLYLNDADIQETGEPPVTAAKMKTLLLQALESARGCRRSDPHLNAGWMHAAGIPQPATPDSGARLTAWARSVGLPVPREDADPDAVTEAKVREIMKPAGAPR